MTRTLVIPDIHTRVERAEEIITAFASRFDQVVFLGDYLDEFADTEADALRAAKWLADSISKPNRVHLVGNHDLAYLAPRSFTRCQGWSPEKRRETAPVLNLLPRDRVYAAVEIDGWLLSHAGFAPAFTGCRTATELVEWAAGQLRTLFAGGHPYLFAMGAGRGGSEPFGGVTWCDWDSEFAPTPKLNQLVGHSPGRHVRLAAIDVAGGECRKDILPTAGSTIPPLDRRGFMSMNLCLDTSLATVALLEGDRIAIIPTTSP